MVDPDFRVIIIGAGPCGLYMARALHSANIDFVVLERGPLGFIKRGNHVLIWPHTVRLFHQLGMFDEIKKRSYDLSSKMDIMQDGSLLEDNEIWDRLREQHGYPIYPIQRCQLLDMLYQSIPDRESLIRTEANVIKIQETEDAVHVHLADGTVETGSVVVGADGTWSSTRSYVQERATSKSSRSEAGVPTKAEYCSIFGEGPNKHKIESGIFFETHTETMGVQLGTDNDLLRFVLYKRLSAPTSTRVRYTEKDMEEVAAAFADVNVTPNLKMGDIWPDVYKQGARLVNQNEGITKHWYTDRVVLTGDAAVTMATVNGLGVNCGLHSVALLASEIQQAVASSSSSSSEKATPSLTELNAAFERYQRVRYTELKPIFNIAHTSMRQMTWHSWFHWFMDRHVKRWAAADFFIRREVHAMVSKGQVLRYVPFKDFDAQIPWQENPGSVV